MTVTEEQLQRPPAEVRHTGELAALRAARRFVVGEEAAGISRKFVGDVSLVERALVTLATNRGLMLVGEAVRDGRGAAVPAWVEAQIHLVTALELHRAPA
ncbi:hypothetical protein [Streptomyces sp. NPDC002779]|uniref:hypothetical protein n=1 Tax=Streptomyces sp. NPDC002779 TaxID=3364664 RepID=UPI0036C19D85